MRKPSSPTRGPAPKRPPSFGADDGGQVLVLCGVLLVLGFVVVGSTVIQMQALDETTARVQRTEIAEPTSYAIAGFERSIRQAVGPGDTNLTDFRERTAQQEHFATTNAVGRGLYMAVKRDTNPTQTFLLEHCGGYHAGRSQDGIVVGYLKADLRESIVGSVYFMHITDGSRTMRWHHYVEIHECSASTIHTYPDNYTVSLGAGVGDVKQLRVWDGGALEFSIKEQLSGTEWKNSYGFTHVVSPNWAPDNGPQDDGGLAASHTGVLVADRYVFAVPEPAMPEGSIAEVTLRIDAQHTPQLVGDNNDKLMLALGNGTWNQTYEIDVQAGEQSFLFEPLSPSGNGHWTEYELEGLQGTIWVEEVGTKDATRVYKVDYINATVSHTEPKGHDLNASFTWIPIPEIYGDHVVNISYMLDADPVNEVFLLEVYNMQTGLWDLVETLGDTAGLWENPKPGFALVSPDHYERTGVNQPQFRIRNDPAFLTDNDPGDLDTLYIDYFALQAIADNDP